MPSERDTHVLVPNASRLAVLVQEGKLPCLTTRPGAAGVIEALRSTYGIEASYLRPARILRGEGTGQISSALYEFDAPGAEWRVPETLRWLAFTDADPATLSPRDLVPYVEKWLAIARGAPLPEARPPWARPGWLSNATAWLEAGIAEVGLQSVGPVELVEQWPLSSVLRCATDRGRVYLKAVFSVFRHEPVLTRELARSHPEVLAVDLGRGWMLMRELSGSLIGDLEVKRWADALPATAGFHRTWSERTSELFALGAHDRRLAELVVEIGSAFEAAGLPGHERAVSELERRCDELGEGPLPQTLVHGDLHPWNVMVDGGELRIFDWSDACVSHPLFDLPTYLEHTADERARESMLDIYLGTWVDVASLDELRAVYRCALPLAHVHHGISYLRINEALEPDDRWWFEDEPRRWLAGAVELLELP